MPSFNIQGSVAFVTGTSKPRGIGRAIVEAFLANGAAKVYATARTTSQLDDLVSKHNGKVVAVPLDVTDLDAIAALSESYPDVTIVVNNAGYFAGSTSNGDLDTAKTEMLVNYIAPMAIGKSFASVFANVPSVEEDVKPTALVNINSIASFISMPDDDTYSASKAASHSLTQAQRRDLPNSLVVGVYPGFVDTDMVDGMDVDKTPPSAIANAVMEALSKGTEDLLPDPNSKNLYGLWRADPKAMEMQVAAPIS
jgi:NAD(P)-dependent dehydrogenase (short-subunit alcohol dehydrogenase family)